MPEIILEGMTEPDAIRDWFYERMRGAKGQSVSAVLGNGINDSDSIAVGDTDEATELLRGIRDNLATLVANSQPAASNHTASHEEKRL